MDTQELSGELTAVLMKMYGMEVFASLMEFCQGELRLLVWLDEERPEEERIPSVMAEALRVTRGRVTAALASLRKKGFVQLRNSERDRRKLIVTLTAEGREYISGRRRQAEDFVVRFISEIGEQRARELIETLSLACL